MFILIILFHVSVLRRKTTIWVWSYTYVQIGACRLYTAWIAISLLLSIMWGTHFLARSLFIFCFEYALHLLCHDYKTSYPTFQALFPFDDWWVVPAKVAFDQTIWAAIWNSIYFVVLGILRFESPISIFTELKATFWPMLTVSRQTSFHPELFHERRRILSF